MRAKKSNNAADHMEKPVALILAGYDRLDSLTKLRRKRELRDAYDGDVIYMGHNKFLRDLAGKPIIQHVLDAVYNARAKGKVGAKSSDRLYEKIYVYNDTKSFENAIDVSRYPNLIVNQMTDSVGGHWRDFYFNYIEYGRRVDVFFGDTPRVTPEDVEWINAEYNKILGKKKDHRGSVIHMVYGIVEYADMNDNWLTHRIKVIKRGHNKGKLKSFVGFDGFQARVGNTGAIIKHESNDGLIDKEAVNFVYNLRKALSPSTFSRIIYHLWRSKHFDMIRQIKNKCISETDFIDVVIDIISKLYRLDLSSYGAMMLHINKNASHWENDIDSPLDYEVFQKKFSEMHRN